MIGYKVVDNGFNRYWNKEIIGKVFDETHIPSYTAVRRLEQCKGLCHIGDKAEQCLLVEEHLGACIS